MPLSGLLCAVATALATDHLSTFVIPGSQRLTIAISAFGASQVGRRLAGVAVADIGGAFGAG
ncbi:MAG: hypothetical protein M1396_07295, partial [Chloroflexi bacterium]|nr:hypothetical protein [Chloroflexota bacterium]